MAYTKEEKPGERPITVKQNTVRQAEPGNRPGIPVEMGITEKSVRLTITAVLEAGTQREEHRSILVRETDGLLESLRTEITRILAEAMDSERKKRQEQNFWWEEIR